MSDDEFTVSVRKFLKHLGVTGHQIIESSLKDAVKNGKLKSGSNVTVSAEIKLDGIGISHKLDGNITAPD